MKPHEPLYHICEEEIECTEKTVSFFILRYLRKVVYVNIDTEYFLNRDNKVLEVIWSSDGRTCGASLSKINTDKYNYRSHIHGNDRVVYAPVSMSLADCILAANVHMGLIPSQNFDPITCNNQH